MAVKRIYVDGIRTATMIEDGEKSKIMQTYFYNAITNNNFIKVDNSNEEIEAIIELTDESYGLTAFIKDKERQYLNVVEYNKDRSLRLTSRHASCNTIDRLSIAEIKKYNACTDIDKRIRSVIFPTEEVWIFE